LFGLVSLVRLLYADPGGIVRHQLNNAAKSTHITREIRTRVNYFHNLKESSTNVSLISARKFNINQSHAMEEEYF